MERRLGAVVETEHEIPRHHQGTGSATASRGTLAQQVGTAHGLGRRAASSSGLTCFHAIAAPATSAKVDVSFASAPKESRMAPRLTANIPGEHLGGDERGREREHSDHHPAAWHGRERPGSIRSIRDESTRYRSSSSSSPSCQREPGSCASRVRWPTIRSTRSCVMWQSRVRPLLEALEIAPRRAASSAKQRDEKQDEVRELRGGDEDRGGEQQFHAGGQRGEAGSRASAIRSIPIR